MKPRLRWQRTLWGVIATGLLGLYPVAATAGSVSLAWDPNPEPDLAGYRVYIGTSSRSYSQNIDVGHVTTVTLPNLLEGQSYFFAVTAYDIFANESGFSNEVVAQVTPPPPPVTPTVTLSIVDPANPVRVQAVISPTGNYSVQWFVDGVFTGDVDTINSDNRIVDTGIPAGQHLIEAKAFAFDGTTLIASGSLSVGAPPPPPTTSTSLALSNRPPTASFTFSCLDLYCNFINTSIDSDGSLVAWNWSLGDGTSSTGQNASHSYASAATYTVTLAVTDNAGATDTTSRDVTVASSAQVQMKLSVISYKVKGLQKADLTWNGLTSTTVDIYRDGSKVTTTANGGFFTDNIDRRGQGIYTYRICAAGTSTCSNEVTFSTFK